MRYTFDAFELDTEKLELTHLGEVVPVEPQVFALIELLVSNADRAVGKDEINERVWGGRVVSDAAVDSRIRSARQALNDSGKAQRFIKTVRGFGFRFVGDVSMPSVTEAVRVATPEPDAEPKPARSKPAIAVLPLQLLSLDTRYEPLADAIAHELIADLSRLRWLHVIARASSFKLRGRELELGEIAELLGVDYVLTGTMSLFGDEANIAVELNDARTQTLVWSEQVETNVDELFSLRGQLVRRVANAIELRIQTQEAEMDQSVATENLDAWMAFFRGLRHVNRFNAHDNEVAMHLFARAIELDPQFSQAHAGLSFAHFQNAFVGYARDAEASQNAALASAEKAFELDQLDPTANLMVGRAKYLIGHWEQAEPWFDRSVQLNPNSALGYYNKALVRSISGDSEDVPELSDQALSLSPIDPLQYAFLGVRAIAHLSRGEYESARHWSEQSANAPLAHHVIDLIAAVSNYHAGDVGQAQARVQRARSRSAGFSRGDFYRALPIRDESFIRLLDDAFDRLDVS